MDQPSPSMEALLHSPVAVCWGEHHNLEGWGQGTAETGKRGQE